MSARSAHDFLTETLLEICTAQGIDSPQIILETPRQKGFGDLSCNVAMSAAKQLRKNPREIAQSIASAFPTSADMIDAVEVAGPGFLNFRIANGYYHNLLAEILKDPSNFGSSDHGNGERWHFEFVSANPTGPLNVVSARAASIGDTLVRVFRKLGYSTHSEYYVNDGGRQVRLLGASLRARLAQIASNSETADIPDGGYHGEYVLDMARKFAKEHPTDALPDDDLLGRQAADMIRDEQQTTLETFLVEFDRWFRESELYESGSVDKAIRELIDRDLTYEKDGARFFRASDFGDSEDRVVITSDGRYTYIVPDIAYHLLKHNRSDHVVTLLGPDHHGHILQLRSALKALTSVEEEERFFHPLIIQQVNLKRSGQLVKMSKRAGVGIVLDELIDEVGVDAARFFFLRRKTSSPLDFDLDVAKKNTDENPAYYVQYAHARIHSILRRPTADIGGAPNLSLLVEEEEIDMIRMLSRFPATLQAVVNGIDPQPLTTYLIELARTFHSFYAKHRIIIDDETISGARVALCKTVAEVIREGLDLMGASAPKKMLSLLRYKNSPKHKIEHIKDIFNNLRGRGFVPSRRRGDTGVVYTLQRELGIWGSNVTLPALGAIKMNSMKINANTKIRQFSLDNTGWKSVVKDVINKYGHYDNKRQRQSLHSTVGNTPNTQNLQIKIETDKLSIVCSPDEYVGIWAIENVRDKIIEKMQAMILVKAEVKSESNKEYFWYNSAKILTDFNYESFFNLLLTGKASFKIELYKYPNGAVKYRGPVVFVKSNSLEDLYLDSISLIG